MNSQWSLDIRNELRLPIQTVEENNMYISVWTYAICFVNNLQRDFIVNLQKEYLLD